VARKRIILDAYTDEPAGLGVPPFLGVWPRYAAGRYRDEPHYLTIDDLRLLARGPRFDEKRIDPRTGKTKAELRNRTRPVEEVRKILDGSDTLIVVMGVQTPGKYLSAVPGTLAEVRRLLRPLRIHRVLTGPAAAGGTQLRGGARAETPVARDFDEVREPPCLGYEDLQPWALKGAAILRQIPERRIVEVETGRGCPRRPGCSFCTEPLKNDLAWRTPEQVLEEVETLVGLGVRHVRLGKQSCIFSYRGGSPESLESLLAPLAKLDLDVLHVDNANPAMVSEERCRVLVEHLTPGSTAALGVETFDPEVTRRNNLNATPEAALEAVRTLDRIGGDRGENGCPRLLPGINLLLGLEGETPETLERNLAALRAIRDEGLLVRRINVRQVVPFPGTALAESLDPRTVRKNRKLYARWIERVRDEIDTPMLRRCFPVGTVLRDAYAETHEGDVTFLRQLGSYPIVIGVRERLPLGERFDVRVTDHLRRSVTGEVVS
jgi:radical SAM superfamily enzyme with C-terminal helix-hairpin-helix motif